MFAKYIFVLGVLVALGAGPRPVQGQAGTPPAPEPAETTGDEMSPEDFAPGNDSVTPAAENKHWQRDIRRAVAEERFDRLDAIAAEYRTSKARLPGGGWQLQEFYSIVDSIGSTDADAEARIALLHRWMAARPQSITPHVALGGVYHRWAWRARGNGTADQVTAEGWRLFAERLALGTRELNGAQGLQESCPHLYFEMLTLGLGQDWDKARMRAILEQAVKAEPAYVLSYQTYANYLQPKWDGETGEATAFAKQAADRLGGEEGDLIYYQLALTLLHRGNAGVSAKEMDWARIQRGYKATKERYGVTEHQENQMAYMAWKFRDAAFARKQFELIGSNWSRGIWKTRDTFDKASAWATNHS